MREFKGEVVYGHSAGKKVAENPDRVILAKDEVGEAGETPGHTHDPKRYRQGRLPGGT
jgi:hypothetical protein